MKVIIYLLGFVWIAAGAAAILYTAQAKAYLNGWVNQMNRTWLALIPAVFGLLLLLAASTTTHRGFILLVGALGIIKGVLIYFNPAGIFEMSKNWMENMSEQGSRLAGIIALVLGTVIISWIQ